MKLMTNPVRPYAWGSRTAIADLLGQTSPSAHPQAELWLGAHPADSSLVDTPEGAVQLSDLIMADPVGQLGPAAAQAFGPRLPYLLKVLAADQPLSLQAHPTMAQAERGFAEENDRGIELSSAQRNYQDAWHKPELLCALTEFHALCGFRQPQTTVAVLSELDVPKAQPYVALLAQQPDAAGVRALFSSLITLPTRALRELLEQVADGCIRRIEAGSAFAAEYCTALELAERYPGDPGVLVSLMMNRLVLQPGQAIFLSAGNLHAYLSGVGVEIMANSDNVLRGGLTHKHVDVPELMRVLDFAAGDIGIIDPTPVAPGVGCYQAPITEFRLCVLTPGADQVVLPDRGPRILLVTSGNGVLTGADGQCVELPQGRSVWLNAADTNVRLSGDCVAYLASDALE